MLIRQRKIRLVGRSMIFCGMSSFASIPTALRASKMNFSINLLTFSTFTRVVWFAPLFPSIIIGFSTLVVVIIPIATVAIAILAFLPVASFCISFRSIFLHGAVNVTFIMGFITIW